MMNWLQKFLTPKPKLILVLFDDRSTALAERKFDFTCLGYQVVTVLAMAPQYDSLRNTDGTLNQDNVKAAIQNAAGQNNEHFPQAMGDDGLEPNYLVTTPQQVTNVLQTLQPPPAFLLCPKTLNRAKDIGTGEALISAARQAVAHIPAALLWTDANGRMEAFNAQAFAVAATAMLNQKNITVFNDNEADQLFKAIAQSRPVATGPSPG